MMRKRLMISIGMVTALFIGVTGSTGWASPTTIVDAGNVGVTVDGTVNANEYGGFSVGINNGFGGVIGVGSELHVGSSANGDLWMGLVWSWSFNDFVVVYIDNQNMVGFADTTGLMDTADPHRQAISGLNGNVRAALTFAPGFTADYAIAFDGGFAGLWALDAAGHTFVATLNMVFGVSGVELDGFTMSMLGLNAGDSFDYVVTLINPSTAWRADEFHGVAASTVPAGNPGNGAVTLAAGDFNRFMSLGDIDGDGIANAVDNCPLVANPAQIDTDMDGLGDACDPCPAGGGDSDGDGVCDAADQCPGFDDNADGDGDGVADGCDPCPLDNPDDTDGDGVCDADDICAGDDALGDPDGDGVCGSPDPSPSPSPTPSENPTPDDNPPPASCSCTALSAPPAPARLAVILGLIGMGMVAARRRKTS